MTASISESAARSGALRRRTELLTLAAVLAGTDLAIKAWAEQALPGAPVEGGPLDVQLAFNPGVAFSFAADAPVWTMLAVTGLIAAVAIALWRPPPVGHRTRRHPRRRGRQPRRPARDGQSPDVSSRIRAAGLVGVTLKS
ncbi:MULTISPECIES: signal peptidase II [Streptomyces]|uniref:signal peptidase II n=1 Tax=Streptomyces TaxID=1883 RepID=UPI000C5D1FF9|nr:MULTISPECIES: signal peptidase II [Streptomyces]PIB03967.1 hypothetical protein B1C81_34955 [Streptomyces sp. HG99]